MLDVIVACDASNGGIGINGQVPWNIPEDVQHFKNITCCVENVCQKNVVIMGRKTWESLPRRRRPLKDRVNVIVSSTMSLMSVGDCSDTHVAPSLDAALKLIQKLDHVHTTFVIGGSELYKEALQHPECRYVYITYVAILVSPCPYQYDAYFPLDIARSLFRDDQRECDIEWRCVHDTFYRFAKLTSSKYTV